MKFTELTEKEYDKFVSHNKLAAYTQSLDFKKFKENNHATCYLVGVKEDNKVVAAALLYSIRTFLGKKRFYSPRGLILDYNNEELLDFFIQELKKYLKEKKAMSLTIDPIVVYQERDNNGEKVGEANDKVVNHLKKIGFKHNGFNNYFETMQIRTVYRLKLTDTYEDLKNTFVKSTRKNIEATNNSGVEVRDGKLDDIQSLAKIFKETADRDQFDTRSYENYKMMYESMPNIMHVYIAYINTKSQVESMEKKLKEEEETNKDLQRKMEVDMVGNKLRTKKEISDKLLEKYKQELKEAKEMYKEHPEGIDIGALISMKAGDEYISLSSGTATLYKKYNPKYALYDAHIKGAYDMGFKYVNFYGIANDYNKDCKYYGIYEFKKGFNGFIEEYIGEFTLPISSTDRLFRVVKKIKK